MATITSANSKFVISIPDLQLSGTVQGYTSDDAFLVDSNQEVETVDGVDGNMSAGFVYSSKKMKVKIMPDSPSLALFEAWSRNQTSNREAFLANATINLPSIGKTYNLTKGAFKMNKTMPDAKKVLQGMEFEIQWQSIEVADA